MKISATPKTMSEAEAIQKARGGGNSIGKAMYGNKDITLKLMYLADILKHIGYLLIE